MSDQAIFRDERTASVENLSYRWAYLFLSFGVLVSVVYRGFVRDEQSWDLIGLVVLAGLIATLYQGREGVLTRRSLWVHGAAVAGAAVLAVLLLFAMQ
jgi:hypothetical protein